MQEIIDAAVDVRRIAGDADQPLAGVAQFGPHRAAHTGAMLDAMVLAAQRDDGARLERRRFRQAMQPRRDPAAKA